MWIPISTYVKCINATHMHGHLIIHVSFTSLHEIFNAFSPDMSATSYHTNCLFAPIDKYHMYVQALHTAHNFISYVHLRYIQWNDHIAWHQFIHK